jgi:hypothetical protein
MVPGVETTDFCIDVEALAMHSCSRIRAIVASSDKTPAAVLRSLAKDPDSSVKLAAALNPICPLDVLETLAVDTDWSVRLGLAAELDVCEDILEALLTHKNPYLAAQSRHALNALALERTLKELDICGKPGSIHRLGELLVGAKIAETQQLSRALELARSRGLRLGRVLLQIGLVPALAIIEALRLQALLRRDEITIADATSILSEIGCGELSCV